MKVGRVQPGKVRGPGNISITFSGLSPFEAEQLMKTMWSLDQIRPLPERKKAKKP